MCELCGCKLNGTKPLDGVSAWKAISTNSSSLRTEVVHDIDINPPWSNATSIRMGQYKLIVDQTGGAPNEACRTMGAPCLFDIYAGKFAGPRMHAANATLISLSFPAHRPSREE